MDPFMKKRNPWDPGLLGDPVRHRGLYKGVILPGK